MKKLLPLLLALSLGLNTALALYHLTRSHPAAAQTARLANSTRAENTTGAAEMTSRKHTPQPMHWHPPKTDQDMQLLVTDLRAAGFPAPAIRAVLTQVMQDRLAENDPNANLPYWKRNALTPEFATAVQKRMDEYAKQTEMLLGPDGLTSTILSPVERQQRYGNLSDEKINALSRIERDYDQMTMAAYATSGTNAVTQSASFKEQRDALNAAKMADLAALMTPEELTQYEMRTSDSARKLMRNIQNLELNEAEYAALYQVQKKYDESAPTVTGTITADTIAQRTANQLAQNEAARSVLNDDRFYQYLQTADSSYAKVTKFTSTYPTLTPAISYQLYQLQTEVNGAMLEIGQTMQNQNRASIQQRMLEMQTKASNYETKLLTLVGPQVAEAYKKDPAGRIFSSLSRLAKPRTPSGN